MRYRFIDTHKKAWPVILMCGVLDVSRSGFYHWRARGPSRRARSNRDLDNRIRKIFARHKQRYGAPRVTTDLHDEGVKCSENRVARRMRALGLRAIQAKKFKVTTDSNHSKPVAPDLLEQDFSATAPNQKWVSDISYVWTDEGWLYLAVVMDLYSRRIIGWSMSRRINRHLVLNALNMALGQRRPGDDLIHHSDRGVQYLSDDFQDLLKKHGITCSMSDKGSCYDNAVVESFFASLKRERIKRRKYRTRNQARADVFDYIERFYNRKRRHGYVGNISPVEFEKRTLGLDSTVH